MTTYTTNVNNGILLSGAGPTEKWGQFLWTTDVWLGPQSIYLQFIKGIINSIAISGQLEKVFSKGISNTASINTAILKEVTKLVENAVSGSDETLLEFSKFIGNSVALSEATSTIIQKVISNAIAMELEPTVKKQRGIWDFVFPGETTDATEQSQPVYTEQAEASTTWVQSSASSTSWVSA